MTSFTLRSSSIIYHCIFNDDCIGPEVTWWTEASQYCVIITSWYIEEAQCCYTGLSV